MVRGIHWNIGCVPGNNLVSPGKVCDIWDGPFCPVERSLMPPGPVRGEPADLATWTDPVLKALKEPGASRRTRSEYRLARWPS